MDKSTSRKSEMESHFLLWRQSGLSRKKYSEEAGIGYHSFLYWIGRLTVEEPSAGSFKQIKLPVSPAPFSAIEIEYPSGVRIRLDSTLPASFIKSLL
jgi:hypothetical protein